MKILTLLSLALTLFQTLVISQPSNLVSMPGTKMVYLHDPQMKARPLRVPSPFAYLEQLENTPNARSSEDCSISADIRVTYSGFTTQAQNAFQHAIDIWKRCIVANVPIRIEVAFESLDPSTLGQASIGRYIIDMSGNDLPLTNVPFPVALANNLVGYDIYPDEPDIIAQINKDHAWYFGTDGNPPLNQVDMVTVVLHEICHGLGFSSSASSDGTGSGTSIGRLFNIDETPTLFPTIFDISMENAGGTSLVNIPNFSTILLQALTSEAVYFDATHARAANGGVRVPLYAPSTFDQGSSISHLDESFNGTVNALMTRSLAYGASIHDPGPVSIAILQDLGWSINQNCFPQYIYVNKSYNGPEFGTILNPYQTLNKAHMESTNGSTIFFLSSGVHDEINPQILNRKVLLRLANGGNSVLIK